MGAGWQLIKRVLLSPKEEATKDVSTEDAENIPEGQDDDDLQAKGDLLKHVFCSNDVPRSPAWDFIHQVIASVRSFGTVQESKDEFTQALNSTSNMPAKQTLTPAQKRWELLRDTMNIEAREVIPTKRNHPGWQLLKEVWVGSACAAKMLFMVLFNLVHVSIQTKDIIIISASLLAGNVLC